MINPELDKITGEDFSSLVELSIAAFHSDGELFPEHAASGPPGYDSEDFHRKIIAEADAAYKITIEGKTAGAVWMSLKSPHQMYLSRIFLGPDFQGIGAGIKTFENLFRMHPEIISWTLDTPAWNSRTRRFYEKTGFKEVSENQDTVNFEYRKKFLVLMGSPRPEGNTAELCSPFNAELEKAGADVEYIPLEGLKINPCMGCYTCQDVEDSCGCIHDDDGSLIIEKIIDADCLVLATPIYSWYCTPVMKALLDRHFCLNKYYRSAEGSLWVGKKLALITTHGYDADYGAGPFVTGIKRLCEHSNLEYLGMYSVRDLDDLASFQTPEAVSGAEKFARDLLYR